ncbi:MAG: hypothetical protein HY594_05645, partial [Candidatus Omnitrophica bacterium]|nr:hypothetical protein [Candidatus Omnitrophota bacterium]
IQGAAAAAQLQTLRLASVIPVRQMAWYAVNEVRRGYEYVEAARQGNTRLLVELMQEAHSGDRAVWDHNRQQGQEFATTTWGQAQPTEAFFRSTPAVDAMIDDFERAIGRESAAGRIMAAGLGGSIAIGVTAEKYEAAKDYWKKRKHEIIEIEPSGGATAVRLDAQAAGLEEIALPRGAGVRGIIIGPEMAATVLPILESLQTNPGERIPLAVVARDREEADQVAARILDSQSLRLIVPVVVELEERADVGVLIGALRTQMSEMGLSYVELLRRADLAWLGAHLHIPPASEAFWRQIIGRAGLETAA